MRIIRFYDDYAFNADEITPGTFWLCHSIFNDTLQPTDIIAKILKYNEDTGRIFILRYDTFGTHVISPAAMDLKEFLSMYKYLGKEDEKK